MDILKEDLSENLDESISEVESLKRVFVSVSLNKTNNFELLSKYAPAMLFSLWEGFFKDAIKSYFSFLNRNFNFENDFIMLTNIIEHNELINEYYSDFDAKKRLLENIKSAFNNPMFNEKRPKVKMKWNKVNKFLEKIKLNSIDKEYYNSYSKLTSFRHAVAHGDVVCNITWDEINDYGNLIIELMIWLEDNILKNSKNLFED